MGTTLDPRYMLCRCVNPLCLESSKMLKFGFRQQVLRRQMPGLFFSSKGTLLALGIREGRRRALVVPALDSTVFFKF